MKVIYQNENERCNSREADLMDVVVCTGGSADIQKENILKNLKKESLEYEMIWEFLADLKKGFGSMDNEIIKMAELKKIEQGNRTMKKFVQEFRRAVRGSDYEERPLIEEFK